MIEVIVFAACAAIVLVGAVGVILAHNPVHSALFLIQTLFGIAVLFIALEAHFLAAVQIVVYAGAIVILFLFVIMLLGVDEVEDLGVEPIIGQRFFAGLVGLGVFFVVTAALVSSEGSITGAQGTTRGIEPETVTPNVRQVSEVLFTDYVFAFEATAILLTIAVVGAVVLSRRPTGEYAPVPPSTLELREEARQERMAEREAQLEADDDTLATGSEELSSGGDL